MTLVIVICVVTALAVLPIFLPYKNRRLFWGFILRKLRWEFWPLWVFYLPVIFNIALLAIRFKSATLFSACNPAIPGGGVVGESKARILDGLASSFDRVARYRLIPLSPNQAERKLLISDFMRENNLSFPIVLKPDVGERGMGVKIIKSSGEIDLFLKNAQFDTIVQEYIEGHEFGVFYFRYPDEEKGSIFSITNKILPVVVGDGINTLERLILGDSRAVCLARIYFAKNSDRLDSIPRRGEECRLTDLGTHSKGAVFSDGSELKTQALEDAFDKISRSFEGFFFGRYDVRTPSIETFKNGEFSIIELNGATSEATHIYDPKFNLIAAYKTLFEQWRICFEIGAKNRDLGSETTSIFKLLKYARTKSAD
jgi:hypothetical protein